jgi:branched-chain amino acid transport system permease protein
LTEALQNFLQQFINGIQTGSVYALIAIGYTMVYGVLKFINFAHGDVYMVGAYIGFFAVTGFLAKAGVVTQDVVALLLCMLGCAALGAFLERLAYRPLRNGLSAADAWPWALFWALYCGLFLGPVLAAHSPLLGITAFLTVTALAFVALIPALRGLFRVIGAHVRPSKSRLTALITAIGISLLLENQGQAVFGATPYSYPDQGFRAVNVPLGPVHLNINSGRVVVLVAAALLTALLVYIVRHTRTGRAIRAVSFDPETAALMGIPTDRVIALTFVIGSALAGAAGLLNHNLGQLRFDPNVGIVLGLKAFVAAVLGGIGSIEGAVLGALLMGLAESYTGGSSLTAFKDAVAFIILIAVLLFRPAGLLGRNVAEKV